MLQLQTRQNNCNSPQTKQSAASHASPVCSGRPLAGRLLLRFYFRATAAVLRLLSSRPFLHEKSSTVTTYRRVEYCLCLFHRLLVWILVLSPQARLAGIAQFNAASSCVPLLDSALPGACSAWTCASCGSSCVAIATAEPQLSVAAAVRGAVPLSGECYLRVRYTPCCLRYACCVSLPVHAVLCFCLLAVFNVMLSCGPLWFGVSFF
jgi:hypothetical protein